MDSLKPEFINSQFLVVSSQRLYLIVIKHLSFSLLLFTWLQERLRFLTCNSGGRIEPYNHVNETLPD